VKSIVRPPHVKGSTTDPHHFKYNAPLHAGGVGGKGRSAGLAFRVQAGWAPCQPGAGLAAIVSSSSGPVWQDGLNFIHAHGAKLPFC
jgi:hypothetical protein